MAIKTYNKGVKTQLSKNFNSTEFDCHGNGCCSTTKVDEKLVKYLQQIRDHFGKAVNINSGYRCSKHNASVGGASKSNHMDGEAADIRISGITPIEVARYAESIGILGIGVYSWGVHVDTRTSKYFWYDGGESNVKTFGGAPVKKEEPVKTPAASTNEMYRVRKSWNDAKSQIGAYSVLQNAKNACNKAGSGYFVFNSKGEVVYPEKIQVENIDTSAINDKVMWDYFKSKGLNDYGIAGLMGNLYAESGFRPTNLQNTYEKSLGMTDAEYTAAVDNGTYTNFVRDSAGYGLPQWTYWSLKQDFLDYVKSKGKSIGDGQIQMEFLCHQLSTDFTSVWNTLKNATSILEASNAVLLKFERPADQSTSAQNKRAEFGKVYYDKYATKTAAPAEPKPQTGFTNSPLVDYVKISPNRTSPRNHAIDTITIHCVVGQCSVETLGNVFAPTSRQASCNYGIGYDGKIGMYVEEKDRSWCSSSSSNDNRAITIEVASDTTHPYAVNDKAYAALIELLVDICKRNNIKELKWKADKSLIGQVNKQNMTVHRWFANKACPGDYLYERHGAIAEAVNKKLGVVSTITPPKEEPKEETKFPYLVKIDTAVLNVRTGAGTNYKINTQVKKNQVYTIVDEKDNWGKLKSGAGWISLDYVKKI